jgi:hypothetical protein
MLCVECQPMFRSSMSNPSRRTRQAKNRHEADSELHAGFCNLLLGNVGSATDYTALYPRRYQRTYLHILQFRSNPVKRPASLFPIRETVKLCSKNCLQLEQPFTVWETGRVPIDLGTCIIYLVNKLDLI